MVLLVDSGDQYVIRARLTLNKDTAEQSMKNHARAE